MSSVIARHPHERDAELSSLSVQIGTLDTERLSRRRHSPLVVLQDGRDVVALEALARLAEVARGHERRVGAVQLQRRQHVFDLNHLIDAAGDDAIDRGAELGEIPRPGQRANRANAAWVKVRGAQPSDAQRS